MVPCDKELMRTMIVTVVSPVFVAFLSNDIFYDIFSGRFFAGGSFDKKGDQQTYKQLGVRQKDGPVMSERCQESGSS